MSLVIPATALGTPYTVFQQDGILVGGGFQITGNPATLQLIYGEQGEFYYSPEVTLPTGAYTAGPSPQGKPLKGLQARNAIAGIGATLSGYFWDRASPVVSFISAASAQAVGAVVIPVVLLADWPPAAPTDGQTVWVELPAAYDPLNARTLRWLATWNQADTAWDVTGPPMTAYVATAEVRANAAYGDLATVGPTITFPILGTYGIGVSCTMQATAASNAGTMSYSLAAAPASDNDALGHRETSVTGIVGGTRITEHAAIAAAATAVAKYKTVAATNVTFSARYVMAWPKRFT